MTTRLRRAAGALRRALTVGTASVLAASAGIGAASADTPSATPVKYYVVGSSYQGAPEFLFEIAQRFLGNGNDSTEIFDLNQGRVEPDGQKVTSPTVIEPGWYLVLPNSATGDNVITAPLPDYPGSNAGTAPQQSPGASSAAGQSSATAPAASAGSSKTSNSSLPLILGIVAVLLLLGAGAWWLLRGRATAGRGGKGPNKPSTAGAASTAKAPWRPKRSKTPAAVPRDEAAAWTIDRALRTLATACASAGREVPGVAAVVVNAETLALRLSAPDERPPAGWASGQQGRTWSAPLRMLQTAPVNDALEAPYPRLVSAGESANSRVLLNLAAAHGLIGLDGDSRLARGLAADWARELANSPWSRGITVLRVGFADQGADAGGVETAASLEAASGLLDEARAGLLVLAHPPAGREGERAAELAADPGRRWSVLVLGNPKNANWRMTADSSGILETGLLGEPVRLFSSARRLEPA
jgi:hypothetical protein